MLRENKTIQILGSEWLIRWAKREEEPRFDSGCIDAFTDHSVKQIVMLDDEDDKQGVECPDSIYRSTLRHEIIHAFLWESGLWGNSNESGAWAQNEEMVDWFAIQHEKLHAAFEAAGALEPKPEMTLEEYKRWCIMQSICTPSEQYLHDVLQAQKCPCCRPNEKYGQGQLQKTKDDEKARKKVERLKEPIEKMQMGDKIFHQISDAVKNMISPKWTCEGNAESN